MSPTNIRALISFEGGEGVGKTTQIGLLLDRLRNCGLNAITLREPGGTSLGEELRGWLKGVEMSPETELLLFAAARAELVSQVINPTLESDGIIIVDRFSDSTLAYQGYARRLPLALVKAINRVATGGVNPDLTFLLDLPPHIGLKRVAKRGHEDLQGKFERENIIFHKRVRAGFLQIAREDPNRVFIISAEKHVNDVSDEIWGHVKHFLESRRA